MNLKTEIPVNYVRQFLFGDTTFFDTGTRVAVTFILDYSESKEIIGIELIGVKKWSCNIDWIENDPLPKTFPIISSDKDADALYLKLSSAKSENQEAVDGNLLLDTSRNLVGFELLLGDLQTQVNSTSQP
jgi:uncharacterized protein YuzE